MGADITFDDGKREFYFRDSYNLSNLAWILGLSYWEDGGDTVKEHIAFFEKLSLIKDKQIKDYVHMLFTTKKDEIGGTEKGWIKIFQEKRNDIQAHMSIIHKAVHVEWSV